MVPPTERGRWVPCAVLPAHDGALLPPDEAGYLILGVLEGEDRHLISGRERILRALDAWTGGAVVHLRVGRNPYRSDVARSWDVELSLPPYPSS